MHAASLKKAFEAFAHNWPADSAEECARLKESTQACNWILLTCNVCSWARGAANRAPMGTARRRSVERDDVLPMPGSFFTAMASLSVRALLRFAFHWAPSSASCAAMTRASSMVVSTWTHTP